MPLPIFLSIFISISILTAIFTWLIRKFNISLSIFDIPNERSSHTIPIPRGGGLVIVIITLGGLLVAKGLRLFFCPWPKLAAYLSGALLIAVISWIDDLHSLPSYIRFCAHCLAAFIIIAIFGFWKVIALPFLGQVDLGLIGPLVSFFWIVGLTNSYNFMDGIDGIAGGQALVAGLGWIFFGWLMNLPLLKIMGVLLAASSWGFLWYNWPKASIFMGDVGSAFLGYSFACLSLIGSQKNPYLSLAGILLVWPFVFDTCFTFLRRLKNRENIFTAHRSHLYQRLVICGYTHQTVTMLYMGLDALGLILALMIMSREPWADMMLIALLPLACFGLWGFTVLKEKKLSVALQITGN